ncbi:MAG: PepSY domain-containing protein [Limimaricola sp.]|uniref:PepSY domain-containing protein n=1 Tax=Limimaricola sp. TaxID=2211665 RepID=UPI001D5C902A|nr:PepSY domain-containing protein [Limimaricola sp.]MBI1417646.1 PepSY domain-containing protein [Limimaricola sp.]
MKSALSLAFVAAALAGPAFAGDLAQCSTAPASKFQPVANLQAMLTNEGMTVKQIKTESGCYEVYAIDKNGQQVNQAYNAETLAMASTPEAGEN